MTDVPAPRFSTHADVATDQASKYLQQLCKHFGHKVEATFDANAGQIRFPAGECRLTAAEGTLTMQLLTADEDARERLKGVLASHLVRFAFREELQIDWVDA